MKAKRITAFLLTIILLIGFMPQTVQADTTVYIDLATVSTNGIGYTCTTVSVGGQMEYVVTITANGTYSLTGTIDQLSDSSHPTHVIVSAPAADIILNGVSVTLVNYSPIKINNGSAVNLIVADGTLNLLSAAAGTTGYPGLYVVQGGSLAISGTGTLNAYGSSMAATEGGAGIGSNPYNNSGEIIINSGVINATGGNGAAGIGSSVNGTETVTINGGTVTAIAGIYAAGIGGGIGAGSVITINDGMVTAIGGLQAAAIGGGAFGSAKITIKGGTIHATGGSYGSGIGGGFHGDGTVTISGGTITAVGGDDGAGIGGGYQGKGIVIITGGIISATSGDYAAGIGGGALGTADVTISGGTITAIRKNAGGSGIGAGSSSTGASIVAVSGGSVKATNIVPQPTSDGTTPVYVTAVTLTDTSNQILANTNFTCTLPDGTSFDALTDNDGKFYLWLPAGDHTAVTFESGSDTYTVTGNVTNTGTNSMSTIVTVTSIQVKAAPVKITYIAGNALNLTGLIITLNKSDGTSEDVSFTDFMAKGITTNPLNASLLLTSNTYVRITYTADNKSMNQPITVSASPSPSSSPSPTPTPYVSPNTSSEISNDTTKEMPRIEPNQPIVAEATVKARKDTKGGATVTISKKIVTGVVTQAITEEANTKNKNGIGVSITTDNMQEAKSLIILLTRPALYTLNTASVKQFKIDDELCSLKFDLEAMKEIQKQSAGNVTIRVLPVTGLKGTTKTMIGGRPVFNILISYIKNGKTFYVKSLATGSVTLSMPYIADKKEMEGYLYGVYVDAKGSAARMKYSAYEENSKRLIFTTNHLSVYGVAYTAPGTEYGDIAAHWAKGFIEYMAAQGIFNGTSKTLFEPDKAISRGMLATVLGRLAGADVSKYKTISFMDVSADQYYAPYTEWVSKAGIINGISDSQFIPDKAITREEMALIFVNYLKSIGYTLPVTREAVEFSDNSSIESIYEEAVTTLYQAGIAMGKEGNKFNPKDNISRAEVSAMLYRYIKLTIDPSTAQGWAVNDSGQSLYYKDGKAVNGWYQVENKWYYFNADGTLTVNTK